MENDEGEEKYERMLKKPEYKRDEEGKFEQHGAAIKKTAKNKLKTKKAEISRIDNIPPEKRQIGRPRGSQNKVTVALKQAILDAGELAGGEGGLTGYLRTLAVENSSAYAGLLGKILPAVLAADAESNGRVETRLTFRRVIVMPNGQEIEAKQIETKALPASHMLPSEVPDDEKPNEINED